jgi:hypothetical protein
VRSDMHKVIVERARLGGRVRGKGRKGDLESLPSREGMRRPHVRAGVEKALNENLGPLERYLRKQVGRPWDSVYNDVSKRLRATSAVQQHVRHHLKDLVDLHVEIGPRGAVYSAPHRRFGAGRFSLRPGNLYVHPRTGLLCVVKKRRS